MENKAIDQCKMKNAKIKKIKCLLLNSKLITNN